jgi:uncharacterized DUF497 family protein
MYFEYDPNKSEANKAKHGVDFEEAQELWNDQEAVTLELLVQPENRFARIVSVEGRMWRIIYTVRRNRIRLISVSRAKAKEIKIYEQNKKH